MERVDLVERSRTIGADTCSLPSGETTVDGQVASMTRVSLLLPVA